jgi:hypothetical protein
MNMILGTKPSRQELMALMRFRLPENAALVELLRTRLEAQKSSLIVADNPDHLRRLQGSARVLQDFLEAIDQSPEILERLK